MTLRLPFLARRRSARRSALPAAALESEAASKAARLSPVAALDNAAYAAVFGPDAAGAVLLKSEYRLASGRLHLTPAHLQAAGGSGGGHDGKPRRLAFCRCAPGLGAASGIRVRGRTHARSRRSEVPTIAALFFFFFFFFLFSSF